MYRASRAQHSIPEQQHYVDKGVVQGCMSTVAPIEDSTHHLSNKRKLGNGVLELRDKTVEEHDQWAS